MNATMELESGYVVSQTAGLKGAQIIFDFPTVGGTENVMMAASLADGRLLVLPIDGDGRPGDAELCEGRFAEALAIMADETAVPLLVAIDREEQILIRPLAERGSAFERLGSLEDVLEGLPGEPPRGRPRVAA